MFLLMRYPQFADVTPIIDLADMIRRYILLFFPNSHTVSSSGVLDTGAHIGAVKNSNKAELFPPPSFDPLEDKYRVDTFTSRRQKNTENNSHASRKPSWLLGLTQSNSNSAQGSHNSTSLPGPGSLLEGGLRR